MTSQHKTSEEGRCLNDAIETEGAKVYVNLISILMTFYATLSGTSPVYMVHKDPECWVYLTAMVSTQVYKSIGHLTEQDFGTDIITYTASLLGKFQTF